MKRHGNFIDLTGQTFGRLTAIDPVKMEGDIKWSWRCKCSCGNDIIVHATNLRSGETKSCGCYQREQASKANRKLPYWWIFTLLNKQKKKGIDVSLTFPEFLEFTKIYECHYCHSPIQWDEYTNREMQRGYHLDRKDNSKGYSKDNCVVCCFTCNRAKSSEFTYKEMLKLGECIRQIQQERLVGIA